MTPRGFCRTSGRHLRPRFRVVFAAMLATSVKRGLRKHPDSPRKQSGGGIQKIIRWEPTYQGSGIFAVASSTMRISASTPVKSRMNSAVSSNPELMFAEEAEQFL